MTPDALTESQRDTLSAFEAGGPPGEPMTTVEVAERLDVSRRSAYGRLERLAERDLLETKKVGSRGRVWWRPVERDAGAGDATDDGADGQFRALVDAAEEYAIFRLDAEGHVASWNRGAEEMKGYAADEAVGEHVSLFYTDADVAAGVPDGNLSLAAERGSVEDEGWRVRRDGSRFRASVTITAIREEGELQGYAKVIRDVTERREYERELRAETALVESVLDNQRDLVYALDPDRTFDRWNGRFEPVTGYADEEIRAMTLADLVAGEATERATAAVDRVFDDGERLTVELPVETADGTRIPFEFSAAPIRDGDGAVTGLTGVGRDVSARKARERQLERERADIASELDDVFDRIDDACYALDDAFRFTYVNDRAEQFLERSEADLLGRRVWEVLPEATETPAAEALRRAMDRQVPTSFDVYLDHLSLWVEGNVYPSEDGLSVYFRDVTERKERERDLELYETIVETIQDGVYVLDENFEFGMVNDAYVEMTGYDREELLVEHCSLVVDDAATAASAERVESIAAGDADSGAVEADVHRADGTTVRAESNFTAIAGEDPGHHWKVGVVRDVSDRVARERELEQSRQRYRTLVENFPNGAVTLVDRDLRYVTVGGTPVETVDGTAADVQGNRLRDALSPELADALVPRYEAAFDGESSAFERSFGGRVYQFRIVPVRDDDGEVFTAMGMSQDVTARRERERELERRVRQQAVVTDLGQRALEDRDVDALMAEAADLVAETLENAYCKVLDLDRDADELTVRQGVGWTDGIVGEATVSAVGDDSQAAHTLASADPVVVADLPAEPRFSGPDLLRRHDVRSGISVVIGSPDDPWGILGTHDTAVREFSEQDVHFVQSVANVLATAIGRHEDEQSLVRQRRELVALNSLNVVARDVIEAVIAQSTREEIERVVCDRLVETDSYAFAWYGDVEAGSEAVTLSAEAGVDGYRDDGSVTTDPDDPGGQGPTATAFRTGAVQVVRDARSASVAAVPVVHEGTVSGVLTVSTDRPNAFEGQERLVIAHLGEIVGHAIAAIERKRALMSDEIVEVEFRVERIFAALGLGADSDGRITVDQTVPVADDEFLVYGTVTADAVDTLERIADAVPHWNVPTVRSGDDPAGFEVRLTDPPVLSVIASLGGYVDSAVVADGDYRLTVHLAPSADVRRLIDVVEETYPSAEMLRRRQVSRSRDDLRQTRRLLAEQLTERQRSALEAAYHAGFFEWPRDTSGQGLADSLDVSPPTFHQHLRKAEKKVFDALLSTAP